MWILLLSGAFLVAAVLSLYLYKRILHLREQKILDNEYNTAVTIWDFARFVKGKTDEMVRRGTAVLDFTNITVPHGIGYRISLQLCGPRFQIVGIPERYSKTGRLSFFTDNTLMVRAADRNGEPASEDDPEYTGETETTARAGPQGTRR
jgi:hypothetical protein